MPWSKIDDRFYDHPKTVAAGTAGAGLFVLALSYCANRLTDGFVSAMMIRRLVADVDDPLALADRLVDAGIFERVEGGYQIHDYLDYNPPAAKVIADRAAAKERMRVAREAHIDSDIQECSDEVPANFTRSSTPPMPVSHDPLPIPESESSSSVADAPATTPKQPEYTALERHFLALWKARYLNSSQREELVAVGAEFPYERIVDVSKWQHREKMTLGHAINCLRTSCKSWGKPKPKGRSNGTDKRNGQAVSSGDDAGKLPEQMRRLLTRTGRPTA